MDVMPTKTPPPPRFKTGDLVSYLYRDYAIVAPAPVTDESKYQAALDRMATDAFRATGHYPNQTAITQARFDNWRQHRDGSAPKSYWLQNAATGELRANPVSAVNLELVRAYEPPTKAKVKAGYYDPALA